MPEINDPKKKPGEKGIAQNVAAAMRSNAASMFGGGQNPAQSPAPKAPATPPPPPQAKSPNGDMMNRFLAMAQEQQKMSTPIQPLPQQQPEEPSTAQPLLQNEEPIMVERPNIAATPQPQEQPTVPEAEAPAPSRTVTSDKPVPNLLPQGEEPIVVEGRTPMPTPSERLARITKNAPQMSRPVDPTVLDPKPQTAEAPKAQNQSPVPTAGVPDKAKTQMFWDAYEAKMKAAEKDPAHMRELAQIQAHPKFVEYYKAKGKELGIDQMVDSAEAIHKAAKVQVANQGPGDKRRGQEVANKFFSDVEQGTQPPVQAPVQAPPIGPGLGAQIVNAAKEAVGIKSAQAQTLPTNANPDVSPNDRTTVAAAPTPAAQPKPTVAAAPAAPAKPKDAEYKLPDGKTLSHVVVEKYGIKDPAKIKEAYEALAKHNGIADPNKVSKDQNLKLPETLQGAKLRTENTPAPEGNNKPAPTTATPNTPRATSSQDRTAAYDPSKEGYVLKNGTRIDPNTGTYTPQGQMPPTTVQGYTPREQSIIARAFNSSSNGEQPREPVQERRQMRELQREFRDAHDHNQPVRTPEFNVHSRGITVNPTAIIRNVF